MITHLPALLINRQAGIKLQITQIIILSFLVIVSLFMQPLFAQTIDGSTSLTINPERSRRVDRIVAIVNDEVITQSDVNRALATIETEYRSVYADSPELAQKLRQAKENIVNRMIEEKLVLSEAKRYDIKTDEDRIEARIERIKEDFAGEEVFERALVKSELTLKDLRDRFRNQEIMKKAVDYFVRDEIKIDPIEIRHFFNAHQEELVHPEKAYVKNILIKVDDSCDEYTALQKATAVLFRLRKGDKFEDLAKEYSQGANAKEGGNLGFIEKGQLIKEIDDVIFKLEAGQCSDVIKTPQGYRIFKLEEKVSARPLSFSEAQDIIKDILYRKKFTEAFKNWLDELKQDAYISIK